jgi:hypothetical protein
MNRLNIRKLMEVIGSCGNKLGSVDRVDGRLIKLAKTDSADGNDHYIPLAWVERIDEHVHLNKKYNDVIPQRKCVAADVQDETDSEDAQDLQNDPTSMNVQTLQGIADERSRE